MFQDSDGVVSPPLGNSHMLSNGPEKGMFVKKKKIKQKMKKEEVNNFEYLPKLRLYFSHRPLRYSTKESESKLYLLLSVAIHRYTTDLISWRRSLYHICAHSKMLRNV